MNGEKVKVMKAPAVIVATFVALGGCCSAPAATWAQDDVAIAACFTAMDQDPALQTVNAKFARRDPTPAQLGDRAVATIAESDALRLRIQKTKPCRELRLAAVRAHRPQIEPAYEILYYQSDQVFDYLSQGLINYGMANTLARDALGAFKARESLYTAADDKARAPLVESWSELLQRAHSNPPPDTGPRTCTWVDVNITCD